MQDKLLEAVFDMSRWEELMSKAVEKGIDMSTLRKMSELATRIRLLDSIVSNTYQVAPAHIARIPKDKPGEFREVHVNENCDRVVLSLINDSLFDLFGYMIHPRSRAYQKGIGCSDTVQMIVKEMQSIHTNFIGYKLDLSKYFDSVYIERIDEVFDKWESELGFDKDTEPVINLLRRYYHLNYVFDVDGNLIEHYGSLKQGCAVASALANVILYNVDNVMSNMDIIYVRYSDDMLLLGKDADKAKSVLEEMLGWYGLVLNPKKVEPLYKDKWFTFLGFSIRNDMITLSRNRVKNFQKEIEKRTIKHRNISAKQAKINVINYLYKGEYNWSTSALGTINVKHDIDELNKFIMDCIRACETGKKKIGGLGYVNDREDYTILRGIGKNVKANRQKTQKIIDDYLTVGCLANDMKISKCVFEAAVRGI